MKKDFTEEQKEQAFDRSYSPVLDRYKSTVVPFTYDYFEAKTDGKVYRYLKYDYNFGLTKRIIANFMKILAEDGINKTSFVDILEHHLKSPPYNTQKMWFNGKGALTLWEFLHVAKFFDFEFKTNENGFVLERKYQNKYRYEESNGRLILHSIKNPKYHINLNTEKYTDFEVDFYSEYSPLINTEVKAWKEINRILSWYFLEQAGKRKLPFDKKIFRALFTLKYNNGEFNNHVRNKDKVDYE